MTRFPSGRSLVLAGVVLASASASAACKDEPKPAPAPAMAPPSAEPHPSVALDELAKIAADAAPSASTAQGADGK